MSCGQREAHLNSIRLEEWEGDRSIDGTISEDRPFGWLSHDILFRQMPLLWLKIGE